VSSGGRSDDGRRVGLVGCVKAKRSVPAPARDLYTSALFAGRRRYVEATCDEWWILSAEHGLVDPDTELAPYDLALKNQSPAARRVWSQVVLAAIDGHLCLKPGTVVEIHAGSEYRDFGLVHGLEDRGCVVVVPTAHMGIGKQLQFYRDTERPQGRG
jgi:hypothetical protein